MKFKYVLIMNDSPIGVSDKIEKIFPWIEDWCERNKILFTDKEKEEFKKMHFIKLESGFIFFLIREVEEII